MGMPEIDVIFQKKARNAINRSSKGVVALILYEADKPEALIELNLDDELKKDEFSEQNIKLINLTKKGKPEKLMIYRIPDEESLTVALNKLAIKKWNYLTIPSITTPKVEEVKTYINNCRSKNKTFKAVLPNCAADNKAIVNLTSTGLRIDGENITTAEYCCRIAGILAGLPFSESSTYYVLDELEAVDEVQNTNDLIDNGELIIINDGEKFKIARGVTSLKTINESNPKEFKKIKIVEGADLIQEDIRSTFEDEYVRKVSNSYDNKCLFLNAVNIYYDELEGLEVLSSEFNNKSYIDIDAIIAYLKKENINIEGLSEQEIKQHDTGSKLFAASNIKFLDSMEDLKFTINM